MICIRELAVATALLAFATATCARPKPKFATGIMGGVARVGFPPQSDQDKIFITSIDVIVLDARGKEVRRSKTNQRGYYWLTLAPGTYTVTTEPNHVGKVDLDALYITPRKVTVKPNVVLEVFPVFDGGW